MIVQNLDQDSVIANFLHLDKALTPLGVDIDTRGAAGSGRGHSIHTIGISCERVYMPGGCGPGACVIFGPRPPPQKRRCLGRDHPHIASG